LIGMAAMTMIYSYANNAYRISKRQQSG